METNGRSRCRRNLALCLVAAATSIQDRYTKQNALIIQNYVELSGKANGFIYPKVSKVVPSMGSLWPSDMYRAGLMRPGTKDGQYTYKLGAGGTSYRLIVHLGSGDWVLTGGTPALVTKLRNAQVKTGAALIGRYVETWSLDNGGSYPASVDEATVGGQWDFVLWPANPFLWSPMGDHAGQKGDYHYVPSPASDAYSLTAYLSGGRQFVVTGAATDNLANVMRDHLKNEIAKSRLQVLKDYVEAWKVAHSGALPTAEEMTATGAVGTAHSWWPANPFTGAATQPGTAVGDFAYTPGAGGVFTIGVFLKADAFYPAFVTAE